MKRCKILSLIILCVFFALVYFGCEYSGDAKLIIFNNTSEVITVEIDEDIDGYVRYLGALPPHSQAEWKVDVGEAIVFIDEEGYYVYNDDVSDTIFYVDPE